MQRHALYESMHDFGFRRGQGYGTPFVASLVQMPLVQMCYALPRPPKASVHALLIYIQTTKINGVLVRLQ